ncbi:MAG: hypothetical protein EOM23_04900, partial [Candidatus Moranbacteria bacterium]|nr:hypothetical protein [Candidatus Moranbacteria bacterium]
MAKKLTWTTVQRKVDDLIPYTHNPRKLSEEKKQILIKSIEKFDLVEIPVINYDNTLIAGHQRLLVLQMIGRGNELIDVRSPNRKLTDEELKEYNIQSNISAGDWDFDILRNHFDDIDIEAIDLSLSSLMYEIPDDIENIAVKLNDDQFEKQFNQIKDADAKLPIVPDFFENHECFIIPVHNEIDEQFIREVFGVNEKHTSNSNDGKIVKPHLISVDKNREIWL